LIGWWKIGAPVEGATMGIPAAPATANTASVCGVQRAAHREERHRLALRDQARRVLAGQVGVKLVIDRNQRDLAAIDAAGSIDRSDVQACAPGHFANRAGDGAREAGRLHHHDFPFRHTLGGNRARRQDACKRKRCDRKDRFPTSFYR